MNENSFRAIATGLLLLMLGLIAALIGAVGYIAAKFIGGLAVIPIAVVVFLCTLAMIGCTLSGELFCAFGTQGRRARLLLGGAMLLQCFAFAIVFSKMLGLHVDAANLIKGLGMLSVAAVLFSLMDLAVEIGDPDARNDLQFVGICSVAATGVRLGVQHIPLNASLQMVLIGVCLGLLILASYIHFSALKSLRRTALTRTFPQ